ncbi:UDP-2,3-diacylglucosamine diphosphatase [Maribellus sp. YY47]|uniref:UDP-2,3-diacylglucosamine diphosphatase n=1 Tax=Maribellus sp. YY47 TaxID=2929486 RepID=UPI002001C36D|nr:UDP-2,3-diacylglucosamine diphosphatase [Maribellus sp. YY47]MCK3685857.1 UDP-2,3-diacylglucosamine diphosphatase [Maribellus sp. YY47]
MSEKGLIYFVSDVHLGAPALKNNRERELLFARWLDEIKDDVAELYLMGDIFDFWYEYRKVAPRGFTRILGRIADLTDRGIPVHFFTGNHDVWVFDYLAEEIGVMVHHEQLITEIRGKKFFLAHGDGLDAADKGYLFLKKIFTSKILQWLFSRVHPNAAFALAHKWSASSRLSKNDYEDDFMVVQDGMYKFAAEFLKNNPVDYFVMGHRHRLVNKEMDDKTRFILLGDWIKSFSYGVFDGEKFELKKYKG